MARFWILLFVLIGGGFLTAPSVKAQSLYPQTCIINGATGPSAKWNCVRPVTGWNYHVSGLGSSGQLITTESGLTDTSVDALYTHD
jgi:hypothetical protein